MNPKTKNVFDDHQIKEDHLRNLHPFERVQIARHPLRPQALDYIRFLAPDFLELRGDRYFRDDRSIIGGIGTIDSERFMLIGQQKGADTQDRIKYNFGMPNPEGYRKALRLMKLAEKHGIPVLTLIDTPGAYAGLEAEERGQARAIAHNLYEMAKLRVPIIVVVLAEGCSGGALAIGVGDSIAMLENSYYTVISPESCASILWKDATKKQKAAETLKLNAEFLLENQIIDYIIKEPTGGAHLEPEFAMKGLKEFIQKELEPLSFLSEQELILRRYKKFRGMGPYLE